MLTYPDVCCASYCLLRAIKTPAVSGSGRALIYVYKRCRAHRATLRHLQATYASISQHTSAYVSILVYERCSAHRATLRQLLAHTSAQVSVRQHMSAYVSIRQHTSAYVSIRQHTSAYVSVRQHTARTARHFAICRRAAALHTSAYTSIRQHTPAYASIRQHTPAYASIRQHTPAYASIRQHTPAYVSTLLSKGAWRRAAAERAAVSSSRMIGIRQHTAAYGSIRQHTSAYVPGGARWRSVLLCRARELWHGRPSVAVSLTPLPACTAYVSIRQHTSAYVSICQHTAFCRCVTDS
jgi:hypothetical protein